MQASVPQQQQVRSGSLGPSLFDSILAHDLDRTVPSPVLLNAVYASLEGLLCRGKPKVAPR